MDEIAEYIFMFKAKDDEGWLQEMYFKSTAPSLKVAVKQYEGYSKHLAGTKPNIPEPPVWLEIYIRIQ